MSIFRNHIIFTIFVIRLTIGSIIYFFFRQVFACYRPYYTYIGVVYLYIYIYYDGQL